MTLAQVADWLPVKRSPHSVRRWVLQGMTARDGTVIKLKHSRLGQLILIQESELLRFLERQAAPSPCSSKLCRRAEREQSVQDVKDRVQARLSSNQNKKGPQ